MSSAQKDVVITTTADTYASTSVLNSGKWAKIRVPSTGIFRLTANVIRQAGFSDINKVRIYGYGGNLVPEALTQQWLSDHDDLPEVPTATINGEKYFYAYGPVSWSEKMSTERTRNPYSDYGYYFITESDTQGAETTEEALRAQVSSSYDIHHYLYEVDDFAWIETGRKLINAQTITSGNSRKYDITVPANSTEVEVEVSLTAGAASSAQVTTIDEGQTYNYSFTSMSSTYERVRDFTAYFTFDATHLAKCEKDASGNYLLPITVSCISGGPLRLDYVSAAFDGANEVPALSTTSCPAAEYVYNITNQNHHADASADLIIIIPTSQKWYNQAKRLGELHVKEEASFGNGFTYRIVPADELYNEFSSGTPDVSAYRRYLKMFYDRAGGSSATDKMPQSVLLFGGCLWDNRLNTLPSYDPDDLLLIYETEDSETTTSSSGIDDFITILGDGQTPHVTNSSASLRFNLGVGRLSVTSLAEATQMVDKIERYMNQRASGPWTTTLVYVGDDDSSTGSSHMRAIDLNANNIISKEMGFDVRKVMVDAYERVSTSTGYRYPTVNAELVRYLSTDGALVINYGGHASPVQLSHENILTLGDIKSLAGTRYSIFFTAACETMPFDQTAENLGSAAMLNTNGGTIAFVGTLRTVYASYNEALDFSFMDYLLTSDYDGVPITIGEALRLAKNQVVMNGRDRTLNKHQYHIFGDPCLRPAIPRYRAVIDEVNANDNDNVNANNNNEAKANAVVNVKGHIETFDGKPLTDYTSTVSVVVKDALEYVTTRNNDGESQYTYSDRLSTLYKGSTTSSEGAFEFTFRVGSDIVDNGGSGLITVYAHDKNNVSSAFGESQNIVFTGEEEVINDGEGPDIILYLNTPSFVNGGTVGATPYLHATLYDHDGLDVMGNTIGHNIELTIDDKQSLTYDLNNYFTFDGGSYTGGTAYYVLPTLSSGYHTLRLRAWDILGNPSTKNISFNVNTALSPNVGDVFISPNPVKGQGTFYIYHDFQGSNAEISIDIIDTTGRLMQTNTWHQALGITEGKTALTWNASSLSSGLYLYRVRISCDGVNYTTKTKKLIVI